MKKVSVFCAIFCCFILLLSRRLPVAAAPTDPVTIPDANLRAAIETRLSKASGATITEAEMAGITGRLFVSTTVSDLTGLAYATALSELTLQRFHTSAAAPALDLSPLQTLTQLRYLSLRGHVEDLSPLRGLTTLTNLILSNNRIVDISPLRALTALKQLHLQNNQITDISPLSRLTHLEKLNLRGNVNLQNISPLRHLTKLRELWLHQTDITDSGLRAVLPALGSLKSLILQLTPISDLSVLDAFPSDVSLAALDLRYMGRGGDVAWLLKDITPLARFVAAGKMGADPQFSGSPINLQWNLALDYESIYTDIPALINHPITVDYDPSEPALERESPREEVFEGLPGTLATFVVRCVNNTGTYRWPFFEKVPVRFTVKSPAGTVKETAPVRTGADGLARVRVRLGAAGEEHTVAAVVPAKSNTNGPSHAQLRVSFTARAVGDASPPPSTPSTPTGDPSDPKLTVTFEDYPEDRPTDEFGITLRFSEPITEFQMADIIVETKLATGAGTAALKALAPTTPPIQICPATIGLPADATGTVRLIVRAGAALTTLGQRGPVTNTASEFIEFGQVYDEVSRYLPPALVVTQIDFAKGIFWVQNTTQYRFNVEMRIYSEDHRDRWFRVSERARIGIEDAETLAFSLTPVETDDASIKHLNSELLLSLNQNQPLKLSSQKFCIQLMRGIPVDTASNMNEDFRVKDTRWTPPGDVIFRQYDAAWDVKLKGLRRDHLAYYRFPLQGQLADSWNVEASVPAAPSGSRHQVRVVLSALRSEPTASGVIVEWTTASELANAGFYVLRSRERSSGFERVSPSLIVGAGTTDEQNTYTYQDTTAQADVPYYYRLEAVSLSGERRAVATVRLRGFISSAGKLLYKWADVKR